MKTSAPNIKTRIEAAENRDMPALARLYAEAAAWIRKGEAPPPEIADWIASRLQGLADALADHQDRKQTEAAAARALLIRRTGKKGKAPAQKTARMDAALVGDVQHFIDWHDMSPYQAISATAAYHARNGGPDLTERIKAAWKQHGK